MQQFSIHHFVYDDVAGEYQYNKNISIKDVMNNVSFGMNKNGGQGNLSLQLAKQPVNYDYKYYDIIQVYLTTSTNAVKLIYTGYIDDITEQYDNAFIINIDCIGLGSDMSQKLYRELGTWEFSKNDTTTNILDGIIDEYNLKSLYPFTKTITARAGSVQVEFKNDTFIKAVDKVNALSNTYYRYVDQNAQFIYEVQGTTEHILTFWKDVQSIQITKESDVVNRVFFTYATGSKTYSDTASQDLYWLHEQKINNTDLGDELSADDFVAKLFAEKAQPTEKIQLTVNYLYESKISNIRDDAEVRDDTLIRNNFVSEWWIELIQPGHSVRVAWVARAIEGIVEKVQYNNNTIQLELNRQETFISLLENGNTNA